MIRKALHRAATEQRGMTLVELLVVVASGLIVLGAAVVVFTSGLQNQMRADSKSAAVQQARVTMERMIRELRQGSGVAAGTTASASQLSLVTYVPTTCAGAATSASTLCRVTYSCSGGTCTRSLAMPDGSAPRPAERVVSGLSANDVFAYLPNATTPSLITVTLSFPAYGGGDAITLTDAAALRNG